MTKAEKDEKLAQADYIDPTGKLKSILEELFKHPEKDWNSKAVKDKIKEINSPHENPSSS